MDSEELRAKIAVIDERSQHITRQLDEMAAHLSTHTEKLDAHAHLTLKNSLDIKWMKTLGSFAVSGIMGAISWIFYGRSH